MLYKAEEAKDDDMTFANELAKLGDLYVNDAFGAAHRNHTSTSKLAKLVKPAVSGLLMEKELRCLSQALDNPLRPFTAVVGGAKVSSKIGVLENLIDKVDNLIIGGGMAYTFVKANGGKIGCSICEDDQIEVAKLIEAKDCRFKLIATDGVFSMDGNAAPLDKICELAEKYDALVMVDECHSAGVLGKTGRGITELYDLRGKVDILTGTLGKAFGGAVGGFTTGRKEIIDMLRQRSRPYLFSNSLPPAVVGASIEMFKMLEESDALHDKLVANVEHFRSKMVAAGFDIKPTVSAICAVMLYDAKLSQDFAAELQQEGVFVTGFYYPVVPKGQARIRVQVSAGHTTEQLDRCVDAFVKVGKQLGVLK